MHPVERIVRELGGIASTAEILRRGYDTTTIRLVSDYGRIRRLRQGWYGVPELADDAARAWAVGGPLACVSAAIHHGLWTDEEAGLHVRVPGHASRLRIADQASVVVHWSYGPATGTRLAVSVDEALATIRRCQPAEVFHAIRRAANR